MPACNGKRELSEDDFIVIAKAFKEALQTLENLHFDFNILDNDIKEKFAAYKLNLLRARQDYVIKRFNFLNALICFLSPQEAEIIKLIANGKTQEEINNIFHYKSGVLTKYFSRISERFSNVLLGKRTITEILQKEGLITISRNNTIIFFWKTMVDLLYCPAGQYFAT